MGLDLPKSTASAAGSGALPTDLPPGLCNLTPYAAALGVPAGTNLAGALSAAKRLLDARYLDPKRPGAADGTIPGINWQAISRALQPNVGNLFEAPTLNIYYGTELRDLGIALAAARELRWVTEEDSRSLDRLLGRLAAGGSVTADRALLAALRYQVDRGVGKGCLTQAEGEILNAPVSVGSFGLPARPALQRRSAVTLAEIGLGWNGDGVLVLTDGKYSGNPLRGQSTHFLRARLDKLNPERSAAEAVAHRIVSRALVATRIRERFRPGASAAAWDSLLVDIRSEFPE